MRIVDLVRQRFAAAMQALGREPASYIQRVQAVRDTQFGDYQANIAMGLAKELSKETGANVDPVEVAHRIVANLKIDDLCHEPEVAPRGFINLRLRNDWIESAIGSIGSDSRLGIEPIATPKTYVLDFSSPNVAKPMHVGHIRSTVIGDAIARILRFVGHKVITDNHLGDWGTQFGMIIYGYKHFVDRAQFEASPVAELSRLYRLVHKIIGYQEAVASLPKAHLAMEGVRKRMADAEKNLTAAAEKGDKKAKKELADAAKQVKQTVEKLKGLEETIASFQADPQDVTRSLEHPQLETRALRETAKLHEGDPENLALWNQFLPLCMEDIHRVYRRLDISFDMELGESYYQPKLGPLVKRLVDSGLATISEGATCVFLEGFDAPMIVRKKDGAFLYATTDLATIEYRQEAFAPDVVLYVVDHRQGDHFSKLFAAAAKIGYGHLDLRHLSFGTVLAPDGTPYKTRSGSVVGLDYLLDEAVDRAFQVVSSLAIPDEEKRKVAEVVGLGAIKYADLVHNRTSDYVFDLDKMVRLEGHTATYVQYSFARTCGILRKAEVQPDQEWLEKTKTLLQSPVERELALMLLRFEESITQSLEEYYPSVLAEYLYDLSKLFASFFEQCSVLNAESAELKESRLVLCYLTGRTIQLGLQLLGIRVVDRM